MRDVGLIEVSVGGRGEIGRPQHRYTLAADAPALGLEPPVMPILARMVLTMADRLGIGPADAHATGEGEGAARAAPYAATPSTLEALVSDLDRLGFDPVVSDPPGPDRSGAVVAFGNCPFGDLAREHPHIVCSLHHGLISGFVAALGDTDVAEFCSIAARTPCRVALVSR